MRAWVGTATAGQKGQTRGPASAREADVRQEAKDAASCFFTDLWRLNGDRPRGAPSKEYLERVRARDLLVVSYVSSYDVSNNPTMPECESMQSVKKNRRTLVEQWWHSSSGVAEQQRVANKWSAGLKPTVFHESLQVNSEATVEGVGEGTGGEGKAQADEDEHRRYGYKDPVIQFLRRSYMHIWGKTKGEHIGWRNHKQWQVKCKSADIPDAPETSFRRWKNKEIAAFDCEPTKDTPESAPIRHRDTPESAPIRHRDTLSWRRWRRRCWR
jgi:hypothetical protein